MSLNRSVSVPSNINYLKVADTSGVAGSGFSPDPSNSYSPKRYYTDTTTSSSTTLGSSSSQHSSPRTGKHPDDVTRQRVKEELSSIDRSLKEAKKGAVKLDEELTEMEKCEANPATHTVLVITKNTESRCCGCCVLQ